MNILVQFSSWVSSFPSGCLTRINFLTENIFIVTCLIVYFYLLKCCVYNDIKDWDCAVEYIVGPLSDEPRRRNETVRARRSRIGSEEVRRRKRSDEEFSSFRRLAVPDPGGVYRLCPVVILLFLSGPNQFPIFPSLGDNSPGLQREKKIKRTLGHKLMWECLFSRNTFSCGTRQKSKEKCW